MADGIKGQVTLLLQDISNGRHRAKDDLLRLVSTELRRVAAGKIKQHPNCSALSPTELVSEMYLRLFGETTPPQFVDSAHFYRTVARVMRNVLFDYWRKMRSEKHGGKVRHAPLEPNDMPLFSNPELVIEIDEALDALEKERPEAADVFMLRHYAGLSHEEVAQSLGVSVATVRRLFGYAIGFLAKKLGALPGENPLEE